LHAFLFTGALANILSGAQNETELGEAFKQHQIINTK
jgi:hypothetical protein